MFSDAIAVILAAFVLAWAVEQVWLLGRRVRAWRYWSLRLW